LHIIKVVSILQWLTKKIFINLKQFKMKKILFTAIALVAFSGVSMANTIADEDVVTENEKTIAVEEVLIKTADDCLLGKFNCYVDARADGFSVQDATTLSYKFYFWCMGQVLAEN
jgi:hypothetical protein